MNIPETPNASQETAMTNPRRVIDFKPGDRVQVRMPSYLKNSEFDENSVYEVKSGPTAEGVYQLWTDDGPRRYECLNDYYLVPALDDETSEVPGMSADQWIKFVDIAPTPEQARAEALADRLISAAQQCSAYGSDDSIPGFVIEKRYVRHELPDLEQAAQQDHEALLGAMRRALLPVRLASVAEMESSEFAFLAFDTLADAQAAVTRWAENRIEAIRDQQVNLLAFLLASENLAADGE